MQQCHVACCMPWVPAAHPILQRAGPHPNPQASLQLVNQSWQIKLCDFNLSSLLRTARQQPDSSEGSGGPTNPRWLPPELLRGEPAVAASDCFSYALCLWELLTWRMPWHGLTPFQVSVTGLILIVFSFFVAAGVHCVSQFAGWYGFQAATLTPASSILLRSDLLPPSDPPLRAGRQAPGAAGV